MHHPDPLSALSSTAGATRLPTTESKSVYAADVGAPKPLSGGLRAHTKPSRRFIEVGSVERTPHGSLRCYAQEGRVIVELRRRKQRVGRALWVTPRDEALLKPGARIPEDAFSVEIREFVGTPWRELDSVSVWTVRGLREKGEAEAFVQER